MQGAAEVQYYGLFGDTNNAEGALIEHYCLWKTSQTFIDLFHGMLYKGTYFGWSFGGTFWCQEVTPKQVDLYGTTL